jgi:uncharacterized membrane protein HdeD (DUF308 family)
MQRVDKEEFTKFWWLLLVSGAVSLILGIALIASTGQTLAFVATLIGIWILIMGAIRFLIAIFGSGVEDRWILAIVGIVGVILGVLVIRNQEAAIATVIIILGLYWLISGLVDFFRAVTNSDLPDRGWRFVGATVSIAAGAVVLLWPAASVKVLALVSGIYLVIIGIIEIVGSFQVKNA